MTEHAEEPSSQIRAEIRARGPMRFDRFQELALYSASGGYYERPGRVGKQGDFVTGASWHPAFARCLNRFLEKLPDLRPDEATFLDVGAGEGELLSAIEAARSGAATPLRLAGVERSAVRRAAAQAAVPSALFYPTLESLGAPVSGLIVGYELFDALPVRALRVERDGSLGERAVDCAPGGALCWLEEPAPDSEAIIDRLRSRGASLEAGQLLEIRPGATELAVQLARSARAGVILVFDYGAPTRALYGPAKAQGTLEAFLRHQVTRDVLSDPGSRDITAWVDFDEIAESLRAEGFDAAGLVSQSRFLLGNGIADELEAVTRSALPDGQKAAEKNALAKLFMPGGMGESIRVLIASKGTASAASLSAFPQV
jgi:SAM-dependent MidA family methyltransferase